MKTNTSTTENYFYELLRKKYHTSETVRDQINTIKESIKATVMKEPVKSFTVKFQGKVVGCSFEKTLKIVSKRLFSKGKLQYLYSFKEHDMVEAHFISTLKEVEALIRFLMKPHTVLHCRQGIIKGASNLLIIDDEEQNQLDGFTPDYIHHNYVTSAEVCEKYTGRLGDYLIFNGVPLTAESIGRELRFNTIETKNRVFTTTGLKEIYVNLNFILLILKLELEQQYLRLRTFLSLENDLKIVEEKIDELGFFSDIFNHLTSKDNPFLQNEALFLDLMKIGHVIESNNWKAVPAYAGYVFSAAKKLDGQFKFLEEYSLFLTYIQCIEKFIAKLMKKVLRNKSDFRNELNNLTANYNELKKLQGVSNHPLFQNDYQELLNSFSKLLAYLDFLTIRDATAAGTPSDNIQDAVNIVGESSKKFVKRVKKFIESTFSVSIEVSTRPFFHQEQQNLKNDWEKDLQKLIVKFQEDVKKVSGLQSSTGEDAFLMARKCVPQLTKLSDILDQLKKLTRDIENKVTTEDPFSSIFTEFNKFEILYKELNNLGILETSSEKDQMHGILTDLQRLLFLKPLKEDVYPEILNKIQFLEDFIISKKGSASEKSNDVFIFVSKLSQNPILKNIIDIKISIQNIMKNEAQVQKIDTFKNETPFFSYSAKELEDFLARIIQFHGKLRGACYYKNISEFEKIEKSFDSLIDEAKHIDVQISSCVRSEANKITREPDVHINYLKNSHLTRRNLEKSILLLQNQIAQMYGFMNDIESYLHLHSFIHSGVASSVLFDQITYILSNIDIRMTDKTPSLEQMFTECVDTIFQYQVGETFKEPKKEDFEDLMKEIGKRMIVRKYYSNEKSNAF